MSQHTPGPWRDSLHSWSDMTIYAGGPGEKVVAKLSIYDEATEETQDALEAEMQANARLIAAAPDMLAEIERLIDREYNPFERDNQSDTYKRLIALRARAT